jgi:lysozyme
MTKERYFCPKVCIYSCMKTRLTFWTIYLFAIFFIYLATIETSSKKVDVGIKQSTIYLIKQFEGLRHTAYDDGYGNMTIGVGHLIKPNEEKLYYTTLSTKQAHKLLERDMEPCEKTIDARVTAPLTQHQFDALMSFCHNVGPDRFANSDVVRHTNKQNYKKAADALLGWNKPEELIKRRKQERKLFLKGA